MHSFFFTCGREVAIFVICFLFLSNPLLGQNLSLAEIGYQTPYRLVKPAVNTAFDSGTSFETRKLAVLKAAETAYGSRARTALGGSEELLARVDGGVSLATRFGVNNKSVRKGSLRAARVAVGLDSDSRFKVLAVDQPVFDKRGKLVTDRDIVYRHRSTGTLGRVEVKEVSSKSQASNLLKYKRQIREMGKELRVTGQPQLFVNRGEVIPELKAYATKHGVSVYENVATSTKGRLPPKATPIREVLDEIDEAAIRVARMRYVGIGVGAGFAIMQGIQANRDWQNYRAGKGTFLQAAYTSSLTGSGASFVVRSSSAAILATLKPSDRAVAILSKVKRIAGPAGTVLAVGAASIRAYQWYSGEISNRQMVSEASSMAGGIAGSIAGAWAGAAVGTLGGPVAWLTVPAGAIIGGIGGAFAAQSAVSYGIETIYARLDAAEQQILFKELSLYYQTQAQAAQ